MEQSPSWEANRSSASQEFPQFYGTRRFISAFTSVRQLSLSWARKIRSVPPHPTSWISILKLSSHLFPRCCKWSFPPGHPTKNLYALLFPLRATCPTHLILLYSINQIMYGNFYKPQNKEVERPRRLFPVLPIAREHFPRCFEEFFGRGVFDTFYVLVSQSFARRATMFCGILLRIVKFLVIYSIFSLLFLVSCVRTISWMPIRIRLAFHACAISGD
jgi:hypothetical protein